MLLSFLLASSLLFQVSVQCPVTESHTTSTAATTPACASCPLNSFYDEDFCPTYEVDGCIAVPASEAITTTTNTAGCLESKLNCPQGTFAYFRSGTNEPYESILATEFQSIINPVFCDNQSSWIFQAGTIYPVDQLACYYKACSQCAENIGTDHGCLDGYTCSSPSLSYSYDSTVCKTFVVLGCTESIYLSFADSSQVVVTQAELMSGAVTIACSNTAQWTAYFTDRSKTPKTVTTIRCANAI